MPWYKSFKALVQTGFKTFATCQVKRPTMTVLMAMCAERAWRITASKKIN